VAYSSEFIRAITIVLFIHVKMGEYQFEYVSTKAIAEYLTIPAPTVVRILKSLGDAGITTTKEGSKGGILLSNSISKITLLDIFLAIEHGSMFKTQIDIAHKRPQDENAIVTITGYLQDAEASMKESLCKKTLEDVFNSIK
jgi:Rrf2 family protein